MSYNQFAQAFAQQNQFGRTQSSGFGMRNAQQNQFGQQSFNQPRLSMNDQFLNSQNGGLKQQRSQTELRAGLGNAFRQNIRAFTPDNMQQFGSSAQSGKQFYQPGMQTVGYTQPFQVEGNRPISTPQNQMMDYTSPDQSGVFKFGQALGMNIQQSNGFDFRTTNMNRTQNLLGSSQFQMQDQYNQPQFFGAQMSREINVETVRSNIATLIKDTGHRTANSFLKDYDTYEGRTFETWELMSIFKLSSQQVRALLKQTDPEFNQRCNLKALCSELKQAQIQVDVQGYIGTTSEYQERFNRSALQSEFKSLARFILGAEFTPNCSNSYREAFFHIKKLGKPGQQDLEVTSLKDFLEKRCSKILNPVQQSRFIEFLQFQKGGSQTIKEVQFVQAMRQIMPDQKRWDLSELLQYLQEVQPIQEKEKHTAESNDPLHPLIEKIRLHLYNQALYNEIDNRFKNQLRLKLKLQPKEPADQGDQTVAPITELTSFLDSLQHDLKLTQKEREQLIARYFVVPQNLPQQDKPPTPPPTSAEVKQNQQSLTVPVLANGTLPKTSSQQSLANQNKELSHVPSGESLARDSLGDSKLNLPPVFNNNKAPVINQQEVMEEEIYEDDNDFDSSRAPGDQKNEADQFEGGSKEAIQKWFSLQKFKLDMQPTKEMLDTKLSHSRPFKFEVLTSMKAWVALTGGSVIELFKLQDKKGTLLSAKRQLRQVLQKMMAPKTVTDIHLNSVLEFFARVNDQGHVCIEYMQFYQFFFKYANLQTIEETDQRYTYLKELHDLTNQNEMLVAGQKQDQKEKKSLGRLLGLTDIQRKPKDQPIEVEIGVLFQVYQRIRSRVSTMRRGIDMQRFIYEKEIKELLQVHDNKFNLVNFQELMGFRKEEEPQFSATDSMRQLCSCLQMGGISIDMMRHVIGKENMIQRFMNDLYVMLQSHGVFDGSSEVTQQISATVENLAMSMCVGSQINAAKFVGKIEFEMHKMVTLEHFYIKLKAQMRANNIDLGEVFIRFGADRQQREISRENLLQMLKQLNMIGEEDNGEFQYFIDEYDSEDNRVISIKQFEDDYEEFVGGTDSYLEALTQKVLSMIMLVSSQYHQSDLVATINTAFESQPTNRIKNTWMQNYDFSRWFQVAIIESQYQNFDYDLIELFLQYTNACDNSQRKMINVPNLLKKIAETHLEARTDNLRRQLASLSVKILQNRIVNELYQRNQRPDQYFQGRFVSFYEFERMLSSGPFNLQTLELNSTIQEIGDLYKRGSSDIALDEFISELNSIFDLVVRKAELFKRMQNCMEEKGQDIYIVLKMIKGQLSSSTHMTLNEFTALINLSGVEDLDEQNVVIPIFEKFELDSHGEVSTDYLIQEFESATKSKQKKTVTFQSAGKSLLSAAGGRTLEPKNKPIVARRNFKTVEQCLNGVAKEIEDRQLSDFGSFLKGYDFTHTHVIGSNDFFKVFSELFKEQVLGKGDILDLMSYFDSQQSGKVDIRVIAEELNRLIFIPDLKIVLVSRVDEVIEDKIFDPIEDGTERKRVEEPAFMRQVVLDLFCGLHVRKQSLLSEWLSMFSRQDQGFISLGEFTTSLEKLDVSATKIQKKMLFDYFLAIEKTLEREEEQKKIGLVPTQLVAGTISTVLPEQSLYSLVLEVVSKICLYLHKTKTPIQDCCQKFELTEGSGEISYVDFTNGLLTQELKLEKDITRNMIEVLQIFFNPERSQMFSFQPFLSLVKQIAFDEGLRIYLTQEDVDFDDRDQNANIDTSQTQTMSKRIPPKAEPSYEVRSNKNTYFNGEKFSVQLGDPESNKLNDAIIISTRQLGVSVEKHFQGFGRFSTVDGLRHLDLRDFREALSALKITWADKSETTGTLYRQIEQIFNAQTITLEMIGQSVYFNSNVNLLREEALMLELVHRELYSNKMLLNVEEVFNFHNFTKDGCQSSIDFQNMLLNHLGLKGKVSDQNIGLLTQRYRVGQRDNKQQVFAFRFVEDLAYQHLNIGVLDQWASKIIEQTVKQLQVKLVIEARRPALKDNETTDEVKSFFIRNCQQSRDEIFYEDLYRTFTYLKLIDETDQMSRLKVDNFFKMTSLPQTADVRSFQSNSVNTTTIDLPISIRLNHFFNALQVLGRKPLTCLYQDVFLQVYFSSKKRGISIYGPDLSNLFVGDDVSDSGQVPLNIFTDRLREKIIDARQNVTDQDLQFLATKYIAQSRGQELSVRYTEFLDDYSEADKNQVSGKLSLIFSPNDSAKIRELQVRFTKAEDSIQQLKTIDRLSEEIRPFFTKMGKYLTTKELDEILCIEMINRDQTREGFLSSQNIKETLKKIGIPLSQNQLQQLVSVLQVDKVGNYSYLELIQILFGARYMQRICSENELLSQKDKVKSHSQVDISKLKISQRLIDQLELRLITINQLASSMSQSKNFIKDQEVFTLLKKADIDFDSADLEAMQCYVRERRDQKTNLVNLTVMLKHFKVGEETSALLYQIQQQLLNTDINSLTSQQQLTFIDFKGILARQNINLPKTGDTLERLFKQISQQKLEVSRATLLRTLKYQSEQPQVLQMPKAPTQVTELMIVLADKRVNLRTVFDVYATTNRVPIQKFEQLLNKHGVKSSSTVTNFFKGTHGDLNLQQMIAYFNQAQQQSQSQKPDEMSTEQVEQKYKAKVGDLPDDIKAILERITQLLDKKRMDTARLFKELDFNGNGLVEIGEFDNFCTKEGLIQGLSKLSVNRLFSYLDSTGDGSISVNELCLLIKSCQLSQNERLASAFTKEFVQELVSEIQLLFDRLDADKNRWLTAQELVIVFKNEGPSNSLSFEQAKQVIDEIDQDSNGRISREEFVNYILQRQKQTLLAMDDQLQDLRNVFSKLVNVKSGFGEEQHLTTASFKLFLQQAGLDSISDQESDDLFKQIDTNQSGTIDIDEIMRFVTQNENIVGSTGTTLLQLRKQRAKLNQVDMFEFLCLLPPYLQPSFTQRFIESQKEGRLSNSLIPSFDFAQFKFGDLHKVKERASMGNREFIAQFKPNFGMELTVTEIKGVPNLAKQLVLDESQNHFEVRYCLFDVSRQTFTSSVLISHARIAPQKQVQKGFVPSYSWCVDETQKTICLRGSENWHIVIELVAFDQRDKSRQIAAGWTSCPLSTKPGTTKLPLRGGSPFVNNPPEILTSENENKVKSGLSKFFGLNKAPVVERHIVVEIQPFFKLDEKIQADIAMMPENTIFFKSLAGFITGFRTYCNQKLQKCELQMQKPKGDLVIAQFSKIYDSPDVSSAIAETWPRLIQEDNSKDKTATVKAVIQRLFALINDKNFDFDHVYPTRSTPAEKLKQRMNHLKNCLLQEKSASPPQPQKNINAIIFSEDYQPFSMNELSLNLV